MPELKSFIKHLNQNILSIIDKFFGSTLFERGTYGYPFCHKADKYYAEGLIKGNFTKILFSIEKIRFLYDKCIEFDNPNILYNHLKVKYLPSSRIEECYSFGSYKVLEKYNLLNSNNAFIAIIKSGNMHYIQKYIKQISELPHQLSYAVHLHVAKWFVELGFSSKYLYNEHGAECIEVAHFLEKKIGVDWESICSYAASRGGIRKIDKSIWIKHVGSMFKLTKELIEYLGVENIGINQLKEYIFATGDIEYFDRIKNWDVTDSEKALKFGSLKLYQKLNLHLQ